MLNTRTALILAGPPFAIWEAVDVFWITVPAAAAVFAALFAVLHPLVLAPRQHPCNRWSRSLFCSRSRAQSHRR